MHCFRGTSRTKIFIAILADINWLCACILGSKKCAVVYMSPEMVKEQAQATQESARMQPKQQIVYCMASQLFTGYQGFRGGEKGWSTGLKARESLAWAQRTCA